MSTKKWRLVEDEETSEFYASCSTLHQQTLTLIRRLRDLLTQLQLLQEAKKVATNRRSSFTANEQDVDVQALDHAVEMLQVVVDSFKEMAVRKGPTPLETQEIPASKNSSRQDSRSTSSLSHGSSRRRASVKVSTAVFVYKNTHWRDTLWQGRMILCYLTHQLVAGTLAYCSNVSEQNHGQRALANIFRLSELYNELLSLSVKDNIGVAMSCRNTCPVLLHPLRKLSITKLLQVLAQKRAEECCQRLVSVLLNSFHGVSFLDQFPPPEETTSPEHTDNSSLEVYRALTRHMTPPGTAAGSILPPVEKSAPCANGMSQLDAQSIDHLQRIEEGHVTTLLCVAAVSAPHLLGRHGTKKSKSTGLMKVAKPVRGKVVEYYQQVLWGEVGTFTEHVVLWWGSSPMGTESPESCQQLRDWLHNLRVTGRVPPLMVPAVQSLMDALCCHVTSTSWDQMFRLTLVRGRHNQHCRPAVEDDIQGTETGQLYARLLRSIVLLCNQCETNAEWLSGPPIEELPLVEQIPVLHRLDHTVHTARLWATSTARGLISAWSVDLFFMVAQSDVGQCMQQLQLLQLADHTDLKEVTSEHVMVCVKMRSKLVSEVRDNIDKLKKVPDECIMGMASVCRTVSLANLHMCFPEPKYWRQSRMMPKYASGYVEEYMDRVLRPVLAALGPLPLPVQQTVGSMVIRIMCEAWLDHIYMHRIKFSEWGALQLLTDFGAVPTWLMERVILPAELQHSLVKNEVLRRCEGVGRLLLRRPGEPINMVSPIKPLVPDSPGGSPNSAPADTMPAEMYVPNQEQWLELRAPRNKGFCAISLCCSS
ncbi:uncharacterized protein [Anabrus simplex]|uniref:uncharacterized protein n=1 Tax=Anabrus simplex TaxID=316456 RepID=UPI0035A2AC90